MHHCYIRLGEWGSLHPSFTAGFYLLSHVCGHYRRVAEELREVLPLQVLVVEELGHWRSLFFPVWADPKDMVYVLWYGRFDAGWALAARGVQWFSK